MIDTLTSLIAGILVFAVPYGFYRVWCRYQNRNTPQGFEPKRELAIGATILGRWAQRRESGKSVGAGDLAPCDHGLWMLARYRRGVELSEAREEAIEARITELRANGKEGVERISDDLLDNDHEEGGKWAVPSENNFLVCWY